MAADPRVKALRTGMTPAERLLWEQIRNRRLRDVRFRRQHPIGPWIVDFVCLERHLVIEVDGGQHAIAVERDEARTKWLNEEGYYVLRFWNNEVMENIEGVVTIIAAGLDENKETRNPTLP